MPVNQPVRVRPGTRRPGYVALGQQPHVIHSGGAGHVLATQDGAAEPVAACDRHRVPAAHRYGDDVATGQIQLEHAEPVLFCVAAGQRTAAIWQAACAGIVVTRLADGPEISLVAAVACLTHDTKTPTAFAGGHGLQRSAADPARAGQASLSVLARAVLLTWMLTHDDLRGGQ